MRRLSFGNPPPNAGVEQKIDWIIAALRKIERASIDDAEAQIKEFSTTGTLTEARTFDAGTAVLADLRNVMATLLSDIKKQGQNRSYAD